MTYLETSGNEAMRLRFRMQKEIPLGYERVAAAICCTEAIVPHGDPSNDDSDSEDNNGDDSGDDTGDDTGARNLQTSEEYDPNTNIGKCFGISLTCLIPEGCSGSTQLGVVFYQSTVFGQTWQAATNDFSSYNVGSINLGTGTDFSTRYGLDQEQAEESSVPLVGANYDTEMGCYVGYDISRSVVQMNQNIDLSDTDTWNLNEDLSINVQENELSPENVVSGAFENLMSIGVLSALVAFFTIF
jgi:hypothetical protein